MDEFNFDFNDLLKYILNSGYVGRANGKTQAQEEVKREGFEQQFCGDDCPKNKKKLIYGIGPGGVPYPKYLEVITYHEILEGDFTIENAETGEASVGELEDQTADRGEEIFDHEADES